VLTRGRLAAHAACMSRSKGTNVPRGHVAVRLDQATIARLDALRWLYALPGREATRSDGLRAVILAGLSAEEQRAARLQPGSDGAPSS
jgi:hypothetical protein